MPYSFNPFTHSIQPVTALQVPKGSISTLSGNTNVQVGAEEGNIRIKGDQKSGITIESNVECNTIVCKALPAHYNQVGVQRLSTPEEAVKGIDEYTSITPKTLSHKLGEQREGGILISQGYQLPFSSLYATKRNQILVSSDLYPSFKSIKGQGGLLVEVQEDAIVLCNKNIPISSLEMPFIFIESSNGIVCNDQVCLGGLLSISADTSFARTFLSDQGVCTPNNNTLSIKGVPSQGVYTIAKDGFMHINLSDASYTQKGSCKFHKEHFLVDNGKVSAKEIEIKGQEGILVSWKALPGSSISISLQSPISCRQGGTGSVHTPIDAQIPIGNGSCYMPGNILSSDGSLTIKKKNGDIDITTSRVDNYGMSYMLNLLIQEDVVLYEVPAGCRFLVQTIVVCGENIKDVKSYPSLSIGSKENEAFPVMDLKNLQTRSFYSPPLSGCTLPYYKENEKIYLFMNEVADAYNFYVTVYLSGILMCL